MALPLQGGSLWGGPGQGTHSFGAAPDNWESDEALDIGVPRGTPVYAVHTGTIGSSFGYLPGHEHDDEGSRFHGMRTHLETRDDEFYYAHLTSIRGDLHPGSHVREGELIGYSGVAANAAHLHFAERLGYPSSAKSAPIWNYAPGGSGRSASNQTDPDAIPPGQPQVDPTANIDPATGLVTHGGGGGGADTSVCNDELRRKILDGELSVDEAKRLYPQCHISTGDAYPGQSVVKDVKGAVSSVTDAIGFLFSFRGLEVIGGGLLVLLGLYLLGKQLGVDVPNPLPGK